MRHGVLGATTGAGFPDGVVGGGGGVFAFSGLGCGVGCAFGGAEPGSASTPCFTTPCFSFAVLGGKNAYQDVSPSTKAFRITTKMAGQSCRSGSVSAPLMGSAVTPAIRSC